MANGLFGGGDGSELKPYLIEDGLDFDAVRLHPEAHFKQVRNISLADFGNWIPIPEFYGVYDGDGFNINDLNFFVQDGDVDLLNDLEISPFHTVGAVGKPATLKNINMRNVSLIIQTSVPTTLRQEMSGLANTIINSTVINCHVSGSIHSFTASGLFITGGGSVNSISKCSANVTLKGVELSGLIESSAYNTTMSNCYAQGKLISDIDLIVTSGGDYYAYLGGITNESSMTMSNCYANMVIDSSYFLPDDGFGRESHFEINPIVNLGYTRDGYTHKMTNCYANFDRIAKNDVWLPNRGYIKKDVYCRGTDGVLYCIHEGQDGVDYDNEYQDEQGNWIYPPFYDAQPISGPRWSEFWAPALEYYSDFARTEIEMKTKSNYVGWDFENIWSIEEGKTFPTFKQKRAVIKCKRVPLTNFRR